MPLRFKALFILLLIALAWLVIADWGNTEPYPLREFPCQFEAAHCWEEPDDLLLEMLGLR